jgi:hypothetical protein
VILALAGLAVFWYGRLRPDSKVAHARELGKQLADRTLSPDQRRELGKQFREATQQLSPEQRGELFKDRREAFNKRIADYFKKSQADQIAQLDEDIKRMDQFRGQRSGNGGPANNAVINSSAEDRDLRKRRRLDQSTPEGRAQRAEYFKQLNDRRRQLGIPAAGGRR